MKDIQREGWEYELTVSLNIDRDTHTATASKDRTELFEGLDPFKITEATGKLIAEWCNKGIDTKLELQSALLSLQSAKTVDKLKELKAALPAYIVSDASFIDAATKKYNLIIAAPVA